MALALATACGDAATVTSTEGQAPEPTSPSTSPPASPPATPAVVTPAVVPERGGVVVDVYGAAVAGATVTLWSAPDFKGPFTPLPDGAAVLDPSNRRNPVVTGPDGTFDWDVLAGVYKLTATKEGCLSEQGEAEPASSGSFRVPPAIGQFKLVLDCRPPDTTKPTIRIDARPPASGSGSTVRVGFTVADNQPLVVAYCLLDSEEVSPTDEGIFGKPCASPYVRNGLEAGAHKITILAMDDHGNIAVEIVKFSVG